VTQASHPEDIHIRIANTIAILRAETRTLDAATRQELNLSVETLLAADASVTELEAELDLVTAPDLSAAEEAQRLRARLEASELQVAALEQRLLEAQEKVQLEDQIHASERDRLAELERQAKKVERLLETDADAFGTYMDNALDQDDRQKGR
jgi:hypothetical protein